MKKKENIVQFILLVILASMFLIPFLIMIVGSLMKMQIPFGNPFTWIFSGDLSFNNFEYIFRYSEYPKWILNSIIISVIPTISQIFFAGVVGFIFARKDFKGKEVLFWLMMGIIMVPVQILLIPRYVMFSQVGWINTYMPLIIPQLWGVTGVFLVRQYMSQFPKELEESAYMDGANDFQVYFKIFMPLSKPVLATVGIFSFTQTWNDLLNPLIYTTSSDMYPITVGLASLLTREGNFGVEMAGSLLSFIPTFVIFILLQEYFTQGIAVSGNK